MLSYKPNTSLLTPTRAVVLQDESAKLAGGATRQQFHPSPSFGRSRSVRGARAQPSSASCLNLGRAAPHPQAKLNCPCAAALQERQRAAPTNGRFDGAALVRFLLVQVRAWRTRAQSSPSPPRASNRAAPAARPSLSLTELIRPWPLISRLSTGRWPTRGAALGVAARSFLEQVHATQPRNSDRAAPRRIAQAGLTHLLRRCLAGAARCGPNQSMAGMTARRWGPFALSLLLIFLVQWRAWRASPVQPSAASRIKPRRAAPRSPA